VAPPACDSVTPPAASAPADPASLSEAGRAKLAAANAAPSATGRGTPVYGIDGIKGYGTVTAVSDTSITVTLEEQIPGGPADATAAFTDKTLFYDGDAQVIDRPAVNVGDRVAFAAVVDGTGGYNLLLLQAHPAVPEASKPDHGRVTDDEKAQKAAGDAAGDSNYVKGTAKIVSVQADSLTLELRDGSLAGQTVTAGFAPAVTYTVGDQKCVDPTLTAGQVVGVLLMRGDADMYTLQAVAIFRG
jgi:hypothetical protein